MEKLLEQTMGFIFSIFSMLDDEDKVKELKTNNLLSKKPLCIAHKGASRFAPENTFAAFDQAVEMDADYLEIDLQLTRDHQFVVCHDPFLKRTANQTGEIPKMTIREVMQVDVGSWFDPVFKGEKIPSLIEVINRYHSKMGLLLELKNPYLYPNIENKLIHLLQQLLPLNQPKHPIVIQSFYANSLKKIKKLAPDLATCLILPPVPLNYCRTRINENLDFIDYVNLHQSIATEEIVRYCQNANKKVFVWPVLKKSSIHSFSQLEVDGIVTNNPQNM